MRLPYFSHLGMALHLLFVVNHHDQHQHEMQGLAPHLMLLIGMACGSMTFLVALSVRVWQVWFQWNFHPLSMQPVNGVTGEIS